LWLTLSSSPNHFLASLSPSDGELIEPHLKPVELALGTVLYRAEEPIKRLYFPYSGIASHVVGLSKGEHVEVGLVGRNSVIGGGAALDAQIATNHAVIQVAGEGVVAEMNAVKRLVSQSEKPRISFARHQEMAFAQTQQIAACNALHTLEERLSRWLLRARDLINSETLPLTQEFLAQMLGVRHSFLRAVGVAAIRPRPRVSPLQNSLRLLGDVSKLCPIRAAVRHLKGTSHDRDVWWCRGLCQP
jgi:CRP-like cAMP-binding protein